MKKVIVSVTNDLFSDQRVDKICNSLTNMGFDVTLVGRKYRTSPMLTPRKYKTQRLHLLFKKGVAFYAEYNIRLFFFLLFSRCNILVANDLDTLLPNFLVSRLKNKKIIYDSHEYFCGVPELVNRPRVQKIWKQIERFCFPKIDHITTVCQSIADIYDAEYPRKNKVVVVRNVPTRHCPVPSATRQSLNLPQDQRIIIMQGAINMDRGAEELIAAMQWIPQALLLIIGDGDRIPALKQWVAANGFESKVRFIARLPFEQLFEYTRLADIGCSLEKDTNINYRYCLPNKLFDYIKAGIPVVVSNLPEMAAIVRKNHIGLVVEEHSPQAIAHCINELLNNPDLYNQYKENEKEAAQNYCWEKEEKILQKIYLTE